MSDWTRINRLELELTQAQRTIERLTAERDLARRVACNLEQENHELASDLVMVPVKVVAT